MSSQYIIYKIREGVKRRRLLEQKSSPKLEKVSHDLSMLKSIYFETLKYRNILQFGGHINKSY